MGGWLSPTHIFLLMAVGVLLFGRGMMTSLAKDAAGAFKELRKIKTDTIDEVGQIKHDIEKR